MFRSPFMPSAPGDKCLRLVVLSVTILTGQAAVKEPINVIMDSSATVRRLFRRDSRSQQSFECVLSQRLPNFEHEATTRAFEDVYALNAEVLKAGQLEGGSANIQTLVHALHSEDFRAVVLGGSFTRGHGCKFQSESELECSWPRRVERWWRAALPSSRLTWENRAEHGRNSAELLAGLSANLMDNAKLPDLVILDLLVNDAESPADTWIAHESLLRALRNMLPDAFVLIVLDGSTSCIQQAARYRELAHHYNITAVDYAMMVGKYNKAHNSSGPDTLWPQSSPTLDGPFTHIGAPWPNFVPAVLVTASTCCPENHPPWPVHQYVADAVVGTLRSLMIKGACESTPLEPLPLLPPSLAPDKKLAQFPVCSKPLTQYSAFMTGGAQPEVISGNWKFFEDRLGRPGWIATERGSRIRFPVRFGSAPVLTISFLRSYLGVGRAKALMHFPSGEKRSKMLVGKWNSNFSLPTPVFFVDRPDAQNGDLIAGILSDQEKMLARLGGSNYERVLEIETMDNEKFKIVGVTSC